jgi:hypothetical protein
MSHSLHYSDLDIVVFRACVLSVLELDLCEHGLSPLFHLYVSKSLSRRGICFLAVVIAKSTDRIGWL